VSISGEALRMRSRAPTKSIQLRAKSSKGGSRTANSSSMTAWYCALPTTAKAQKKRTTSKRSMIHSKYKGWSSLSNP
jgi:hypothetical protein